MAAKERELGGDVERLLGEGTEVKCLWARQLGSEQWRQIQSDKSDSVDNSKVRIAEGVLADE